MSFDNRVEQIGKTDHQFSNELRRMNNTTNFTGKLIEHLQDYWGKEGIKSVNPSENLALIRGI